MSSPATPSKTGATFLWVLGAFAGFAILLSLIQAVAGRQGETDPRAPDRAAFRTEIDQAQQELVAKMGVADAARREAIFTNTLAMLQARAAAASTQVVPGSPTQLKQAAADAAAAPPAAPAEQAPETAPGAQPPAATPAQPAGQPTPAQPAAPAPRQ